MWDGTNPEGIFPMIIGHEWAGEVIEVGSGVTRFKPGQRVLGECGIACHMCSKCKAGYPAEYCENARYYGFMTETPGAMAEYQTFIAEALYEVPQEFSFDEASLVEPVSIAFNSVYEAGSGVTSLDRVLIFGAGPIGLAALVIVKSSGAQAVVAEINPYRQKMALDLGADEVIDPAKEDPTKKVMEYTGNQGASLILECSASNQAIESMLDCVAMRGRVVLVGQTLGRKIPIEIGKTIFRGASIIGNHGSAFTFINTMRFMSQHTDITKLITHRFPLEEIEEALTVGKSGMCGKIVMNP
jgi:threonine dehydrogenase-like Zn-dependent dehydrogenase